MNEKEVKIKIEASYTQKAMNTVDGFINRLKEIDETLKSVKKNADGSLTIKSVKETADKIANITRKYNKEGKLLYTTERINNINKSTDSLGKTIYSAGTKAIATFTAIYGVVKGTYEGMAKLTTASINYSEALNLFNVVFKNVEKNGETTYSKLGKQAIQFQNKLKNNFGTNMEESLTYQGLFQSMAESQGISEEAAYIMSENSTKLVYDLSSLFNKEQEDVAEALRAGIYAGQTKPLRTYGLDITETSLQVTLDKLKETNNELGNLKVSTMSQAEKQILRYITVLEQASVAHGDYAATLESPANQMKVLQNQIQMTAASIGNLFIKPFQRILVFTNAILITIRYLADAIAKAFNIDVSDYNQSMGSYNEGYEDFKDKVDKTTDALKKLKRQTLGFDQINNLTTNVSNNNGLSDIGGIDNALLNSLKEYENGLEEAKLEAQKIAEKIMEWLGFTIEVNEETGEISWKFEKITGGTLLGAFAVGGTIYTGIYNIFKIFKKMGLLKIFDSLKDVSKLKFGNLATTFSNGSGSILGIGLLTIAQIYTTSKSVNDEFGDLLDALDGGDLASYFKIDSLDDLIDKVRTFCALITGQVGLLQILPQLQKKFKIFDETIKKVEDIFSDLVDSFTTFKDNIVGDISERFGEIKTAFEELGTAFGELGKAIEPILDFIFDNSFGLLNGFINLEDAAKILGDVLGALTDNALIPLKNIFEGVFSAIRIVVNNEMLTIKNKIEAVTGVIEGVTTKLKRIKDTDWSKVWEGFKSIVTGAFKGIKDFIKPPVNTIITICETMANAIVSGINIAIRALNKINVKLPDWKILGDMAGDDLGFSIKELKTISIPRLKTGMDFVPKDYYGPVYLDYGERVLTRAENQAYTNGLGSNSRISDSIKNAIVAGVSQALATSGGSNVRLDIRADEGIIVEKAINGINRITDATGESPLHI